MGGYELIVVVVFFLVGYWVVDFFWPKKKADAPSVPVAAPMSGLATGADQPWHEVLGVAPDATHDQIRKAYEDKSAQYNPARLVGMGPEFTEAAVRATRRINDAYEEALRAK